MKPSNVKDAEPGRQSFAFLIQALAHISLAFAATYAIVRTTGEPWPGDLLFFPWMEIGPLVWPINIATWGIALVGACYCFARVYKTDSRRTRWVLSFHVCVAGIYLIPIVLCVFGTYVGP